jgi:hypothetical protein
MSIHQVPILETATGNFVLAELDDDLAVEYLFNIEDGWLIARFQRTSPKTGYGRSRIPKAESLRSAA